MASLPNPAYFVNYIVTLANAKTVAGLRLRRSFCKGAAKFTGGVTDHAAIRCVPASSFTPATPCEDTRSVARHGSGAHRLCSEESIPRSIRKDRKSTLSELQSP